MKTIVVCMKCGKIFSKDTNTAVKFCSDCGGILVDTGISVEEWTNNMTDAQRQTVLQQVADGRYENKSASSDDHIIRIDKQKLAEGAKSAMKSMGNYAKKAGEVAGDTLKTMQEQSAANREAQARAEATGIASVSRGTFPFGNAGKSLKTLAQISFWLVAIAGIIAIFTSFSQGGRFFGGLTVIIVLVVLLLVFCMVLMNYAIGELTERTMAMEINMRRLVANSDKMLEEMKKGR